jgi:hypothetical protein
MASRDEWFAIHTADSGDGSLSKSSGPRRLAGGFRIDSEAAPAVRTAFEGAIQEMQQAKTVMHNMRYLRVPGVNPVVDKYVAALVEVGYGDNGSVTMAADSAVTEYQNVVDQLNQVTAGYKNSDDQAQDVARRLGS